MSHSRYAKSVPLKRLFAAIVVGISSLTALPAFADGVSQQFDATDSISRILSRVLPVIHYDTNNLSEAALDVNSAQWQAGQPLNRSVTTKIQALLNWHNHGIGAVDGFWGKNTRHAMQAFQEAHGLQTTDDMNQETWNALTAQSELAEQPVLVMYTVQDDDINIKTTTIPEGVEPKAELEGLYYESVVEALGEKFHMDVSYLKALNSADTVNDLQVGDKLIVYNPGNPNTLAVTNVAVDKSNSTLYAYDDAGNMLASYPTTVGSTGTPSPSGEHSVEVKVYQPNYTYTHEDGSKTILPPGPNNPVGLVWIGLSKPSYGIHGSPEPERISRQASAGCVRLTNWDALALYGTIKRGAMVAINEDSH